MRRIKLTVTAVSTTPGYVNGNGQMVVRDTGVGSESRAGQRVYKVRCSRCRLEYGVNGIDVEKRLCPGCQGGVAGEKLREMHGPGLFD